MVGENNSEVFIANSDGTAEQNLTNHPAFDGWPAWSPGGNQIAFASNRDRNYEIYIMNVEGSGVQKVANNEGGEQLPRNGRKTEKPSTFRFAGKSTLTSIAKSTRQSWMRLENNRLSGKRICWSYYNLVSEKK